MTSDQAFDAGREDVRELRRLHAERVAAGLCPTCGKPASGRTVGGGEPACAKHGAQGA